MSDYEQVERPAHYLTFPDMQAIDIIKQVLTTEEFLGYCKGNILKYRLRAGEKGEPLIDIAKADKYRQWMGDFY